jgi:hypothetical protein
MTSARHYLLKRSVLNLGFVYEANCYNTLLPLEILTGGRSRLLELHNLQSSANITETVLQKLMD